MEDEFEEDEGVDMDEEGGGKGEEGEYMKGVDVAIEDEEERVGEMVEKEGKETVEPVMDWEEVKEDVEEVDKGTEKNKGAADG